MTPCCHYQAFPQLTTHADPVVMRLHKLNELDDMESVPVDY